MDITRARRAVVVATIALGLGACGTSSDQAGSSTPTGVETSTQTEASGFPVTVEADNGAVAIASKPTSIVSLSPTATEMLFAIGAAEQVTAVDAFSNHPPEAPTTDLSGFQPNLEAILGYAPDLVVLASDPGDIVSGLGAAGVPVLLYDAPAVIEGAYSQIEQLGAATGNLADAVAVVGQMQEDLAALVESLPDSAAGLSFYHELGEDLYSVTSSTFIGQAYELFGLVNIADQAGPDAGPYPDLSAEFVIEAAPDLIFLADVKYADLTADDVAARDGWSSIPAVQHGAIIELDDDVASRWGPRIVDYLAIIAEAIKQLATA